MKKKWDIFNCEGYYLETKKFPAHWTHYEVFTELLNEGYFPNITVTESNEN